MVSEWIWLNYDIAGQVDVSSISSVMDALSRTVYIGAYRNAINQGAGQLLRFAVGYGTCVSVE